MNNGPILIVDDDTDDREFLKEAWGKLNFSNQLIFLDNAEDVIAYLEGGKETPFLILCDVNLPKMDGFELKVKLKENPSTNHKSIPLVFWSDMASKTQVQKAYELGVNGFFIKESSLEEIKNSLVDIVNYWLKSVVPE